MSVKRHFKKHNFSGAREVIALYQNKWPGPWDCSPYGKLLQHFVTLKQWGFLRSLVSAWLYKTIPLMLGLANSKHNFKGKKSSFILWSRQWIFFFFFALKWVEKRIIMQGIVLKIEKIVSIGTFFRLVQKENVLSLFLKY